MGSQDRIGLKTPVKTDNKFISISWFISPVIISLGVIFVLDFCLNYFAHVNYDTPEQRAVFAWVEEFSMSVLAASTVAIFMVGLSSFFFIKDLQIRLFLYLGWHL
jgi:hypothetical protein